MKILFIGMGSIGTRHYNCLKKYKEQHNLEFISYKTNLNKDNKNKEEDIQYFDTLESALLQEPDCAVISNPTSIHIETAIKCANIGLHMFIEKPLSNTLTEVDKLIEIVKEKNLITLMGCNLRYHPILIDIKNIITSMDLGKGYDFNICAGSYLPDWRPWQDYTKSYSAKKSLGGGVLLDLIHEIDYTYWLFGEFIEVKSLVEKISDLDIETEDCAKILVKTKKSLGTISLNYYRRNPERKIYINFEKGSIIADLVKNELIIENVNGITTKKYEVDRNYTYEKQMEHFLEAILNKSNTENDVNTGLKTLKYVLHIKKEGDSI